MSTDNFKQVLLNDGEGISPTDFNNIQQYLESKIWDQIFHNSIGSIDKASILRDPEYGAQDGANHPTSRCYCLNPGHAFLRQGSANHKIQLSPGTLLQKIAAISGDDATTLAYTFAGTEEWTLTNGDASNPRVDLLQIKLEYITGDNASRDFEDATTRVVTTNSMDTTRRVKCTMSVKAGTPGASPAIPEPDSGYVPVGSVMVGNGWTTAGAAPWFGTDFAAANNVVVHDQRMPIRVRAYYVDPSQFKCVTAWALSNSNTTVTSSNATNDVRIPCLAGLGRLVGIGWAQTGNMGSGTLSIGKTSGSTNFISRNTVAYASDGFEVRPFFTFEGSHAPSAGPTITQSVTTKIGVPIWTNGQRCPREVLRNQIDSTDDGLAGPPYAFERLMFKIVSGGSGHILGPVVFYVAEGI